MLSSDIRALRWRKRGGFSCALIGYCWQGEAVGGLTGKGHPLYLGMNIWLSPDGPVLEVGQN